MANVFVKYSTAIPLGAAIYMSGPFVVGLMLPHAGPLPIPPNCDTVHLSEEDRMLIELLLKEGG